MTQSVIDFSKHEGTLGKRRLADLPDRVVEGDPHHETRSHFTSPDGTFLAGTWTSTPGKWHAFSDRDEFCYIISGHVQLISEDGETQTFRAGDSFLIPNGFSGFWNVIETTTKHFVIRDYSAK
ncbi:cupin domain-containing protein [Roseobacter sp. EG26]|uniref:cupin domain-containing protein n=1 Tax=Roseobacter sp. EG26 TaxID=3412477 RepID=UPI002628EB1F|nr:cupin domain-containing protein [uncultured Roseobacter sp.]